jgi:hypothetical protein
MIFCDRDLATEMAAGIGSSGFVLEPVLPARSYFG